ncbi:hypothetical protein [Rhodococcus sp. ACPA4]|uniref:hypothetical protein n=1 Tax=Rhodococcus sp. ACPA4 TaxID=2028571 RepID=UPI003F8DF698
MSAANAGLTVQHGTSGRTLKSDATNRALSAVGESLTLMWTGATWARIQGSN